MSVTLDSFKAAYPEFVNAPDGLLNQALAQALREADAAICGQNWDDLVMLKMADRAARSPYGRSAQLMMKDGSTIYTGPMEDLVRIVAVGKRVF
jgi:hypothetical protein